MNPAFARSSLHGMRLFLVTAVLALNACQNDGIEDLPQAPVSFKLANGNYLSEPAYDDYNPVVARLSNGYLALVFASNRTCGATGCTANNIFVATSVTPYSNDGHLPAFNAPQIVLDNGSASNFAATVRLAVVVSGTNINVYFQTGSGLISNTNTFNPVSASPIIGNVFGSIAEYNCYSHKMLGLDASNLMFAVNAAGTLLYRFNPATSGVGCMSANVSNSALGLNKSVTLLASADTGISDAYFATDASGTMSAQTATRAGPKITTLTSGLANYSLQLTNAGIFNSSSPAGSLLIISASTGAGSPSDMYAITSPTPGALWRKYVAFGTQPSP